jgi:hypothetical protein
LGVYTCCRRRPGSLKSALESMDIHDPVGNNPVGSDPIGSLIRSWAAESVPLCWR